LRQQLLLVGVAPPPPIGGPRALEGHWTDVPSVPVKPFAFGASTRNFGWLGGRDDLTTRVLPIAFVAVRQVYVKVGDAVAKGAPLFVVEPESPSPDATADQDAKTDGVTISAPAEGVITKLDVDVGSVIERS
jgi:hypothetical protein